jgi:hypothetical protein
MLLKILAVFLVGLIGGFVHRVLFEKRIYLPKIKHDSYGRYVDLGLVEDVVVGVIVAFAVALPIIDYVPVLNLVATALLPAIAGKSFLKSAIQQYVEERKHALKEEIADLEAAAEETEKKKAE